MRDLAKFRRALAEGAALAGVGPGRLAAALLVAAVALVAIVDGVLAIGAAS